ncbi:MAG: ABC transporter substrate-binding protein [Candidatus Competibacteraceae bacterium]|jgi:ABC-type branched-subunit amino acid transport system substrate-binding protein|nr:ABC transporter substrate-binding protein [Candidatus Competibacteraceae bacterium]
MNMLLDRNGSAGFKSSFIALKNVLKGCWYCLLIIAINSSLAQEGVTDKTIRIGGVMDLEGASSGLGQGMKAGIEAAFKGEKVQNREIEFLTLNDSYQPEKTIEAVQQLIDQGIFLMLGNVGTPTARVALPILAENKVPAVGFFTGAGLLRPGVGDVINYRASYAQEIASLIKAALAAGVKPAEVCALVQNDSYGMAGVQGLQAALTGNPEAESTIEQLAQILNMEGEEPARNGVGPVGVYRRNTLYAKEGYKSLKQWEETSGAPCRLVVTVGTYVPVANFIGYARYKNENWVFSAVSFTGAESFRKELIQYGVTDKILMTQVVPELGSELPIVQNARKALGDQLDYVSLEGYIAGKLVLRIMSEIDGELTRSNFLKAAQGKTFDLGGLQLDFVDDNQASDFVLLTDLRGDRYDVIDPEYLEQLF